MLFQVGMSFFIVQRDDKGLLGTLLRKKDISPVKGLVSRLTAYLSREIKHIDIEGYTFWVSTTHGWIRRLYSVLYMTKVTKQCRMRINL